MTTMSEKYENFASWLQAELSRCGWDQAELARRGGIAPALISRILSGERHPGATTCRGISRALHISPEVVFRQAGLLPKQSREIQGANELMHYFQLMPEEDRKRLIKIARSLSEPENINQRK